MTNLCEISFSKTSEDNLLLTLTGNWKLDNKLPLIVDIERHIKKDDKIKFISFEATGIDNWDTSLLTFLIKINGLCSKYSVEQDNEGLPQGVKRLLKLSSAVPERKGISHGSDSGSFITRIGEYVIGLAKSSVFTLHFIGEVFLAFVNMLRGKVRFRGSEFLLVLQECGVEALPIVTLISLLIGLILAFMGAIQLKMFGAEIYVADLVGLGMAREMGAMMTAIIMAGRTGAAFAAQIGAMHVDDEIDALRTFGIPPVDALVLPRMITLALMLPLLCLYADFLGIVGGTIVGVTALDISFLQFCGQIKSSLGLVDFATGLFKSFVFGIIIAVAGCLKGIQCGKSSTDVGKATTSAVVTSIVFIIISDAILTIIYDILNI